MTRDDLPDGGADHFRRCILAVRERTGAAVEVLTPDFLGDLDGHRPVLSAAPGSVQPQHGDGAAAVQEGARPGVATSAASTCSPTSRRPRPQTVTKSGLMLGIGETIEELFEVLADLRAVACDTLTLGQYLAPTLKHVPVARFVPPAEFDDLAELARTLGFKKVVAGPFVRSSYHADEMVQV